MALREIQYKPDYRSGYDDLVADLFRPSLHAAKHYWRAVGYFSSSALESFGAPLGAFLKRDGHIRLITSVELSADDLEAIKSGITKKEICSQRLEHIIDTTFSEGVGDGTARLALLLELKRLEIRIAVPKNGTGLYHEKIGIFFDEQDFVAFTGSSNESRNAFENNRECVDVYSSWNDTKRAHRKRAHFEALWNKTDPGVLVFEFPEAARRKLIRASQTPRSPAAELPKSHNKWRHQDEALAVFMKAERGVLNMATGTGKTRIALNIIEALFDKRLVDTIIVCTDGIDLLDQWYEEVLGLFASVRKTHQLLRHYEKHKQLNDFILSPAGSVLLISRPQAHRALRSLSPAHSGRTLLIHDEVHRLGSQGNRNRLGGLSDPVRFRLGLSATPERKYDEEGTKFIETHIGPVLMSFGLEQAICRGILAPFHYFALPFELSQADKRRIQAVYRKQAARTAAGSPMSEQEVWTDIARVYKTAEGKIPVFAEFIETHQDLLERSIVFVETRDYGNAILEIIHGHRADFHTYYSGEEKAVLKDFASGRLECLMTCHRLSEGIDIRSLNSVILFASDRTRLETIQRIGRCLRTDPNNPTKIANIVDFIRGSTAGADLTADEERRDWLSPLANLRPD